MEKIRIQIEKPLIHHWSGKYEEPGEERLHITRNLTDFELILMISGELYVQDEFHEYTVKAGEYLLMHPTKKQAGTKPSECSFYWMHFSEGEGQKIEFKDDEEGINYHKNWIEIPKQGTIYASERLVVLMKQLQDMDKRYHEAMINNYLASTILCEIQNQVLEDQRKEEQDKKQLVCDIKEYVKIYMDQPIKVQDVAEHFGYNEKYLTTMFHKNTGRSIKQFIMDVKMDRARTLLTDSNFPVSEIAFSLGFRSVQQFSSVFRKEEGMPPSDYRNSYPSRLLFNK